MVVGCSVHVVAGAGIAGVVAGHYWNAGWTWLDSDGHRCVIVRIGINGDGDSGATVRGGGCNTW